jgi:hypothetical protein
MNCIRLSLTIQLSLRVLEFGFISQSTVRTSTQETVYSFGNRISFPCVRRSLLKSAFGKYPTSQWRSPGIVDPSFSPANLSTRDCILPPFKISSCKSNSILPTISSAVRRSESQSWTERHSLDLTWSTYTRMLRISDVARRGYQVDSSQTGFRSFKITRVEYIGLPYFE